MVVWSKHGVCLQSSYPSALASVGPMLSSVLQTFGHSEYWKIQEHLQHFCCNCSHCPYDHSACILCRRSSSDLAKAMSIMSHHATAAYVILGIITSLLSNGVILGESPQVLTINALHDHRAYSTFFTCALMCDFHVSLSSRMTPRYLTSFDRFN